MQVLFHAQHYGNLAVGLSDINKCRKTYLDIREESPTVIEREKFYVIDSGGICHPWINLQNVSWVAITGGQMITLENTMFPTGKIRPQIFAKVQPPFGTREVHFEYRRPETVIGYGFPDPVETAKEILRFAKLYNETSVRGTSGSRWFVVDKKEVPNYHRSLLGKVMKRITESFVQGQRFFTDMKAM